MDILYQYLMKIALKINAYYSEYFNVYYFLA